MTKQALQGSDRASIPGAQVIAPADAGEHLQVTVLVRRRAAAVMHSQAAALAAGDRSKPSMSRADFAAAHGADPADFAAVRTFAGAQGLSVELEESARRTMILAGTVAQFSAAFSVQLHQMKFARGTYRGRTGTVSLPPELTGIVEAVLGLDNRPQAKAHFRRRAKASTGVSYSPPEVAALYGFPAGAGAGECVGIIELGGGFRQSDLDTYFGGLGVGSPKVIAVSVDNGKNTPGSADGPDGEVMLDVEVIGSIAPKATLAVYFAPNTDAGFLDAVTTAIHDTTHRPSVISISWGGAESSWTSQAMAAMDSAFQAAATMGITVCVASGDNGSSDGATDGSDHVDFPASSSFALGCGGTRLKGKKSTITSETVWNDGPSGGASGGGISSFFPLPTWQAGLKSHHAKGNAVALAMRGVPDVAGNADPDTGYNVRVDGEDTVIGGTSAVAPLWAALIARINAIRGTAAGFINPRLYASKGSFRDVTKGNNGDFEAAVGWDACTGLGTPDGKSLTDVL